MRLRGIVSRPRVFLALSLALGIGGAPVFATAQQADGGKQKYTAADVARWPDFTTGSWGDGAGPALPLLAHDWGFAPQAPAGGRARGETPPDLGPPGPPGAARRCGGSVYCTTQEMPLTPEFRKSLAPSKEGDRNEYNAKPWSCEPGGVVLESGQKFYYTPGLIIIGGLSDYYNVWRRIYMDGQGHPDDYEPSYFGHSTGRWEGDTLVIDTVRITQEAKVAYGIKFNSYNTHLVERIRLIDPDTIEIKKTVTNPDVFTKPVEFTITRKRLLGQEFPETFCYSDREEAEGEVHAGAEQ